MVVFSSSRRLLFTSSPFLFSASRRPPRRAAVGHCAGRLLPALPGALPPLGAARGRPLRSGGAGAGQRLRGRGHAPAAREPGPLAAPARGGARRRACGARPARQRGRRARGAGAGLLWRCHLQRGADACRGVWRGLRFGPRLRGQLWRRGGARPARIRALLAAPDPPAPAPGSRRARALAGGQPRRGGGGRGEAPGAGFSGSAARQPRRRAPGGAGPGAGRVRGHS